MATISPIDIEGIYTDYLDKKQEENRLKRYSGKESWYHASGAGSCSRKLYFESVEQIKPSNPLDAKTKRLLRLGNVLHDDFEKSLVTYNRDIYNRDNTRDMPSDKEKENKEKEIKFHTEEEITIDDLNVRGFYDAVVETDEIYLYDFKTCGGYSWKLKFGRKPAFNPSIHYELQLGTYGYAIKEKFGRIDGMYLYYYNKDTSLMRPVSVPLTFISRAYLFWRNINDEHKQGLPPFRKGVSPVQDWQCNYCQFLDHCNPQR
jgi:CRISPR/Cas system-associated exonuclease Cas4 (RecB family)